MRIKKNNQKLLSLKEKKNRTGDIYWKSSKYSNIVRNIESNQQARRSCLIIGLVASIFGYQFIECVAHSEEACNYHQTHQNNLTYFMSSGLKGCITCNLVVLVHSLFLLYFILLISFLVLLLIGLLVIIFIHFYSSQFDLFLFVLFILEF